MTDLRTAAQQGLEALKMMRDKYEEYACPACDHADAAIYALKAALVEDAMQKFTDVSQEIEAALAEDVVTHGSAWSKDGKRIDPMSIYAEPVQEPAQQDNETIAQTFSGLPKRKLRELLAAGWQINGVCFQRTEEDGTVRRGAATTGGMVLWWNQEQPAQQQEPVAWRYVPSDVWGDPIVTQDPRTVELARQYGRPIEPLYTAPPQRKPLTEEEIVRLWYPSAVIAEPGKRRVAFGRAIERAHGIGGQP